MNIDFMDNDGTTHKVAALPCPFCGGDPKIIPIGNSHTKSRKIEIMCANIKCGNRGFVVAALVHDFAFCLDHAVNKWNKRQ